MMSGKKKEVSIDKAISILLKMHRKALNSPYVKHPVAWALYHTWKLIDDNQDGIIKVDEINVFDQREVYCNCTVEVLTNSVTGETSVGWWRNDTPPINM